MTDRNGTHLAHKRRELRAAERRFDALDKTPGFGADLIDAAAREWIALWNDTRLLQGELPVDLDTVEDPATLMRSLGIADKGRRPIIRALSEVEEKQVEWIWAPWIPRGELSGIQGPPGVGKSLSMLTVAAAITSGGYLPGPRRGSVQREG